jgi:hypothetical protein
MRSPARTLPEAIRLRTQRLLTWQHPALRNPEPAAHDDGSAGLTPVNASPDMAVPSAPGGDRTDIY